MIDRSKLEKQYGRPVDSSGIPIDYLKNKKAAENRAMEAFFRDEKIKKALADPDSPVGQFFVQFIQVAEESTHNLVTALNEIKSTESEEHVAGHSAPDDAQFKKLLADPDSTVGRSYLRFIQAAVDSTNHLSFELDKIQRIRENTALG